jgi:hypothetical protein
VCVCVCIRERDLLKFLKKMGGVGDEHGNYNKHCFSVIQPWI